jgi:hypothetical protein
VQNELHEGDSYPHFHTDCDSELNSRGTRHARFRISLGGTVERLLIYALGDELDAAQMAALKSETEPGDSREEMLESLNAALTSRSLDPVHRSRDAQPAARGGPTKHPSTVTGFLVHIAGNTQRHVGQVIATAKIVRSMRKSRG